MKATSCLSITICLFSPNGPVRFNLNVQSLVNVIDLRKNQDAGQTIHIQSAVGSQTNPTKLFVTQPWAIAIKNSGDFGYVVSAANIVALNVPAGFSLSLSPQSSAVVQFGRRDL